MRLLIILFTIFLVSCTKEHPSSKPIIGVQTLSAFPASELEFILDSLPKVYDVDFALLPEKPMYKEAFYKPRNRYRADSIIRFLRREINDDHMRIMGVTAKEISTTKGENKDWGICGLAFRPGKSAVVSTYRFKGEKKRDLTIRVAIHELGHSFGLKHCPNDKCVMASAKGKVSNIAKTSTRFCRSCFNFLDYMGLLRDDQIPLSNP